MLRPLVVTVFASLGIAALGSGIGACSGKIEETSAPAPSPEPGPTSGTRPPPKGQEPDPPPPLRDVTTPLVIDLGNVAYGQEITLTVPAGALGFNVVLEDKTGTGSGGILGIERITSPSGEVVHDAYTPKGGSHSTSESGFGTIASVSVPQSEAKSANTPEPGAWRIRIGGANTEPPPPPPLDAGGGGDAGLGPASLHAEARIQLGSPSGFAGGRLDLNVFVPAGLKLEGKTLDAKSADGNEDIERRLNAFFGALDRELGIERGKVTFVPTSSRLQLVDDDTTLLDGFSASAGRPDAQALNLLLTNAIDFGGGSAAWGIAPGIPGAAARTGTAMSGIILAVGDTPAIGDGLTILHEAGHFFGLNHTTELYDGYADPLSDTPKCMNISIDDPLSLRDCPDGHNIMFPAFYGAAGAKVVVSEAQRAVVRGSPIYKAYKDAVKTKSTMGGVPAPIERLTLTRSGRALTPVETWLSGSLCAHVSHGKVDVKAFARTQDPTKVTAALRAAAIDPDLPEVMRRKAVGALQALGVAP